jgi:hypothetical protein
MVAFSPLIRHSDSRPRRLFVPVMSLYVGLGIAVQLYVVVSEAVSILRFRRGSKIGLTTCFWRGGFDWARDHHHDHSRGVKCSPLLVGCSAPMRISSSKKSPIWILSTAWDWGRAHPLQSVAAPNKAGTSCKGRFVPKGKVNNDLLHIGRKSCLCRTAKWGDIAVSSCIFLHIQIWFVVKGQLWSVQLDKIMLSDLP